MPRASVDYELSDHSLYIAQAKCCYLCGAQLSNLRSRNVFEHVIPRHVGGEDVLLAHPTCDKRKGGRMPTDDDLSWLSAIYIILEHEENND